MDHWLKHNSKCNELGSSVTYLKEEKNGNGVIVKELSLLICENASRSWLMGDNIDLISILNVIIRFLQGKPLTKGLMVGEGDWTKPRDLFPAHHSLLEHRRCSCFQSSNKKQQKRFEKKTWINNKKLWFLLEFILSDFEDLSTVYKCCSGAFIVLCGPMGSFLRQLLIYYYYYYLFF